MTCHNCGTKKKSGGYAKVHRIGANGRSYTAKLCASCCIALETESKFRASSWDGQPYIGYGHYAADDVLAAGAKFRGERVAVELHAHFEFINGELTCDCDNPDTFSRHDPECCYFLAMESIYAALPKLPSST